MNVASWRCRIASKLNHYSFPVLMPLVIIYFSLVFSELLSARSIELALKGWVLTCLVVQTKKMLAGPENRFALGILVLAFLIWFPCLFIPYDERQSKNLWTLALLSSALPLIHWEKREWKNFSLWIRNGMPVVFFSIPLLHLVTALNQSNIIGRFENPHYLGIAAILLIPIMIYWQKRFCHALWQHTLIVFAQITNLYLLLLTQSRPAWIALFLSFLISLPFIRLKHRLLISAALISLPLAFYFTNVLGFADRVTDLVVNLAVEERVGIWQDSWKMQMSSNFYEWLFGHGLGMFHEHFMTFSRSHGTVDYYSPHNFFLEVLYNNGIYGLLIMSAGFCLIITEIIRLTRHPEPFVSQLALLLLITFTSHFLMTFLTLPIFAPKTICFLVVILGGIAWLSKYVMLNTKSLANSDIPK